MGTWGTWPPVELEFAVNLEVPEGKPKEFGLLQMRPLVINNEIEELDLDNVESAALICRSDQVLGHGVVNNVKDIICIDLEKFDRKFTHEVAHEIAQFNSKMINNDLPYLLIGLGRWGTL